MWCPLFGPLFRHFVFTPVREWFSAFAPLSPLCLHSGAPVGPQARIVVSLCLHFGRQLALSSLAPAVGPFSLSLSPLGSAKRFADVRSPERACRSELELVSEAAKRVGASLVGG